MKEMSKKVFDEEPIVPKIKLTGFVYGIRLKNTLNICYINYSYANSLSALKELFRRKTGDTSANVDLFILDVFDLELENDGKLPFIKKLHGKKHSDNLILQYNPTYNKCLKTFMEKEQDDRLLQSRIDVMRAAKDKKLRMMRSSSVSPADSDDDLESSDSSGNESDAHQDEPHSF